LYAHSLITTVEALRGATAVAKGWLKQHFSLAVIVCSYEW